MKRYIGIDYGKRRVGVAVSDPTGTIARPLETITIGSTGEAVARIAELVAAEEAVGIVVGLPLNLSGDASELSEDVRRFADKLGAAVSVPIYFEDERLSSRQAEQVLHNHGKKIKGNKGKIDRIAAAVILQTFLDRGARPSGL